MTTRCRACDHATLLPVLSLGELPPANRLLEGSASADGTPTFPDEPRFPLDLVFCPNCSLTQITTTLPSEMLFANYPYFSSFSDTMVAHARTLAERVIAERGLSSSSQVIEIASNDGYLLQHYATRGVPVLGIEPAANVAEVARTLREIPTLGEFFGRELGKRLAAAGHRADVLHSHNVLAHVADLHGFLDGAAAMLRDTGVWIIEVPYLFDLLDRVEFDTIYHEHLCYFSLTALEALLRQHGLLASHVERLPIHGGSLRVWVTATADGTLDNGGGANESVASLLADERQRGVLRFEMYAAFAQQVAELRTSLRQLLGELKSQGKRIAAYGASAKGSTLLGYCGLGRETLDFVVDRSTVKQGRWTPGSHLPIVSPRRLREDRPDYVLLLTWNFQDEILKQQAEYRMLGGKFIVPIPAPRIV